MAQDSNQESKVEIPAYLRFSKIIGWLMYFWVFVGVAALTLRVFLLAFSANMAAGFANFIMRLSNDYMAPFRNIFTGRAVGETGYLDVSALFAIVVYLFIGWGFKALIDYIQGKIDASAAEQKTAIRRRERQQELKELNKASKKKG